MTPSERKRCLQLRLASKRGQYIAPEDFKWLESMWAAHPDEYKEIGNEVSGRTMAELNPLSAPTTYEVIENCEINEKGELVLSESKPPAPTQPK